MDEKALKFIQDHKNPIVKEEPAGSKLFLKATTKDEVEFVEKQILAKEKIFRHDRVDRRCARVHAVWLEEQKLAKVTKIVGILLKNFGFQNKDGIFLLPEEMLFLLETNRLEISFKDIPLSIQEAYHILLHCPGYDLAKYRVYKKLTLQGYRLIRKAELEKRKLKCGKKIGNEQGRNKHSIDECLEGLLRNDTCEVEKKKIKTYDDQKSGEKDCTISGNNLLSNLSREDIDLQKRAELNLLIAHKLQSLRDKGPKQFECKDNTDSLLQPEYFVFTPTNTSRVDYDFNLFICDKLVGNNHNYVEKEVPNVFAVHTNDNIAFYRLSNVTVPCL